MPIKNTSIIASEPRLYAYTLPGSEDHKGLLKVGQTDRPVDERVAEQVGATGCRYEIVFSETAIADDGHKITDYELRHALMAAGFDNVVLPVGKNHKAVEWMRCGLSDIWHAYDQLRHTKQPSTLNSSYVLRDSQQEAVDLALTCFSMDDKPVLWNAKPRFGKTLATYDLMMRMGAKRVLVLTHRPGTATSWADDFNKFVAPVGHWHFVSRDSNVKGLPCVIDYERFEESFSDDCMVAFVSLQDLEGSAIAGGSYDKLDWVFAESFDLLVVDEEHDGAHTDRADAAFSSLSYSKSLWLSGTPYRALADGVYEADHIFNWTYIDEQEAKQSGNDAYDEMPELVFMGHKLGDVMLDMAKDGLSIGDNQDIDWAFDLGVLFEVKNGRFSNATHVKAFLNRLFSDARYPFGSDIRREQYGHSLWVVDRVDTARALARMLKSIDTVKNNYEIVDVSGDLRETNDDNSIIGAAKALSRVRSAIRKSEEKHGKGHGRTITISAGRLTVGVTVSEWSAVVMLSNTKSAQSYVQTAFRAQNPRSYLVEDIDGTFSEMRKERAFVFDFDPTRMLEVTCEYARNMGSGASDGVQRDEDIKRIINFLPIYSEDDDGNMLAMDFTDVLKGQIRYKAREVVRKGFMSNHIFKNGLRLFGINGRLSDDVLDILSKIPDVPAFVEKSVERSSTDDAGKAASKNIASDDTGYTVLTPSGQEEVAEKLRGQLYSLDDDDCIDSAGYYSNGSSEDYLESDIIEEFENADVDMAELGDVIDKTVDIVKTVAADVQLDQESTDSACERVVTEILETVRDGHDVDEAYNVVIGDGSNVGAAINDVLNDERAKSVERTVLNERNAKCKAMAMSFPMALLAYGYDFVESDATGKYMRPHLREFVDVIPDNNFEELMFVTKDEFTTLLDSNIFDEDVLDEAFAYFMHDREDRRDWFSGDGPDIYQEVPRQSENLVFPPRKLCNLAVELGFSSDAQVFSDCDARWFFPNETSGLMVAAVVRNLYSDITHAKRWPDARERLLRIFADQIFVTCPSSTHLAIVTGYLFGRARDTFLSECYNNFQVFDLSSIECGHETEVLKRLFLLK